MLGLLILALFSLLFGQKGLIDAMEWGGYISRQVIWYGICFIYRNLYLLFWSINSLGIESYRPSLGQSCFVAKATEQKEGMTAIEAIALLWAI